MNKQKTRPKQSYSFWLTWLINFENRYFILVDWLKSWQNIVFEMEDYNIWGSSNEILSDCWIERKNYLGLDYLFIYNLWSLNRSFSQIIIFYQSFVLKS